MSKLLIIGAGGHGHVVANIATELNKYSSIEFIDDNVEGVTTGGYNILNVVRNIHLYKDTHEIIIAVGDNFIRKNLYYKLINIGCKFATLIHPSAIISKHVIVEEGTVIMPAVIINCGSNIGKMSIINTNSIIEHDNQIGDFVHLSPGTRLAGGVTVESKSWLGIGSIVINNIRIGSNVVVGAGAVIINNIHKPGTYIGIPARRYEREENINISE